MRWLRDQWRASSGYRNPVWNGDEPWAVPTRWYTVPWRPVRIYLRVGDALLFRLWWFLVPVMHRLVELAGAEAFPDRELDRERAAETVALSAGRHDGHGCALDQER